MCVCTYVHMPHIMWVQRSEDNLRWSVPSFSHLEHVNWIQAVNLGSEHLYLPRHPTILQYFCF